MPARNWSVVSAITAASTASDSAITSTPIRRDRASSSSRLRTFSMRVCPLILPAQCRADGVHGVGFERVVGRRRFVFATRHPRDFLSEPALHFQEGGPIGPVPLRRIGRADPLLFVVVSGDAPFRGNLPAVRAVLNFARGRPPEVIEVAVAILGVHPRADAQYGAPRLGLVPIVPP